jgi:hypothetical protein
MRLFMPSVSRQRGSTAAIFLRVATVLALCAATAAQAAPDATALIARLARTPPARIAFTEVRFSSLLEEPLVVSGTLEYESEGGLNRRVETPYRENTGIRGESVRVERDGETRTFALRRAPELRGFLTGMLGLLTGDSPLIDKHFDITASGDDERWRLDLEPTDDRLRQRLRSIVVAGGADEPRCFVIVDTEGGASVMMLGPLAESPLTSPIILAELMGRCAE